MDGSNAAFGGVLLDVPGRQTVMKNAGVGRSGVCVAATKIGV
jgi:hypothetical protein